MDSDVREVIRRRIAIRERDGHERLLLNHEALRALLDAADERDTLAAAVKRVREMHVPFRIYGECECEDTTTPGHVDIEEVGITCNFLYVACRECCTSGADIRDQTEDCAYGHDHRDTYCPTIAALDGDEP